MTHQEELRKSLRFYIMRKLWIKTGNISRWAGNKIVEWSSYADKLDFLNKNR